MLFMYDILCIYCLCRDVIIYYGVFYYYNVLTVFLGCYFILCCLYMTFNVFTVFVRMSSYSMLFIYDF